ncbi:MAG: TraR/DksA C4-type zinc finger protein [Chitinispirillaceae bacterium]|nr:TraR/DksA C4-type zinc finger protein [Chitinispirillaceae bacterium]
MSDASTNPLRPRAAIQQLLLDGNVRAVLEMAGMLHGHYCVGLALGVKAVHAGFKRLGIIDNTGMEEIMAVAECNSCFVDGIQFAAGCTLGNNALVYQDLGKTAATFYCRGGSVAVRVCVKSYDIDTGPEEEKREGDALFEKAVKRREKLSDAENTRMKELWNKRSFAVAAAPDERCFLIADVKAPAFAFAPIFDSQQCVVCGEKVMESKAVFRNGQPHCLACAGEEYRMVVGKGISVGRTAH